MDIKSALDSEESLDGFFASWRNGTLERRHWTHPAHLLAALLVIWRHGPDAALREVRAGILHLNFRLGIYTTADSGYHETVTRFWVMRLTRALDELPATASRLEAARLLLARFSERRDWYGEYWSADILRSSEARREWLEPDRKLL